MSMRRTLPLAAAAAAVLAIAGVARTQDRPHVGYKDTPMLPGGKWHVHDGDRPQPPIIEPGTYSTQEQPGKAPSDAVVLFDGGDLSKWRSGSGAARWKVEDGAIVTGAGAGTLETKDEFGDCQLHVEFSTPDPPKGSDQGRGNSGVLIMGRYEVQVLDSFENITYADGQAAAIYGQYPPMVNASRPPGQWQTYDIVFEAPRFKDDGTLERPAYATVFHNGVLVQNHEALLGPMVFRQLAHYTPHGPKGPLALQDHGNPVRYRNLWVREIERYEER